MSRLRLAINLAFRDGLNYTAQNRNWRELDTLYKSPQAVPWCIVDSAGNTGFCYQYPACEVCQTPEDQDKYCDEYAG